jgi:hypothetical protein
VLCCLEGLTRDEAAQQIGCTASVLKGRLEHGRERLRQRLIARGLTLPCGLGAILILEGAAGATVPPALISSTTKAAITVAAGKAATTVVTAKVAALAEGVIRTMFLTKMKIAIVALVLGFIVTGATVLSCRTAAAQGEEPVIAVEQPALEWKPEPKEAFTAWGKEVGGLQAGLGFRPGEKRAYHHGEAVAVVLRVRNVGKEAVDFNRIGAFFVENPPTIMDADGKMVQLPRLFAEGLQMPHSTNVAPGKAVELYEWCFDLRPKGVSGKKGSITIHGTGRFSLQCERIVGPTSFNPNHPNPAMSKLATGKLEVEIKADVPPKKQEKEKEKEGLTAWGKEVGGLQAGLGFRPGERRVYRIGETITFVVRVRNVGKKDVKIESLNEFFNENAPSITDGDGKPISLEQPIEFTGIPAALMQENLAPGKEAVLCELDLKLRPASEKGKGRPWTLYETGKFQVQFEKVGGNIGNVGAGIGTGEIRFDPILSKLATGKLEVEVKADAPKQQGTRQQAAANLSVLMGALHKYHDDPRHGRLPPAVIMGKDGKGGVPHSWRVEILPYLGEKALYDAYRFDEPWDSKHNKALIAPMPAVFRSPRDKPASTFASYFALVTPGLLPKAPDGSVAGDGGGNAAPPNYDHGTVFSNPAGTRLREIPDGTSNTVALVEARREVPWTQPEDISYWADKALPKLG